jgi:hypothetical protein
VSPRLSSWGQHYQEYPEEVDEVVWPHARGEALPVVVVAVVELVVESDHAWEEGHPAVVGVAASHPASVA